MAVVQKNKTRRNTSAYRFIPAAAIYVCEIFLLVAKEGSKLVLEMDRAHVICIIYGCCMRYARGI